MITPTISFPLTGGDYELVIAALRRLEDDLHDCGQEGAEVAAASVALRAKMRDIRNGGVRRAEVIRLIPSTPKG